MGPKYRRSAAGQGRPSRDAGNGAGSGRTAKKKPKAGTGPKTESKSTGVAASAAVPSSSMSAQAATAETAERSAASRARPRGPSRAKKASSNASKANASKANASKANASKANASKANASKANASKAASRGRAGRAKQSNPKQSRGKAARAAPADTRHADRHIAHSDKPDSEELRRQLLQYMDTSGYVSWSAKNRRYTIRGTGTNADGLVPCPSCGVGQLLVIKSPKSGKRFMGCSNFYGGCDASSPLLQRARLRATKKPCKACGWPEVIFRYSSKQKWTRQCSNIACPTRSQARRDG